MPCSSEGYDDSDRIAADAATRAACDMVRVVRSTPSTWDKVAGKLSAGTLAWVQRHDELDARREREEVDRAKQKRIRDEALAKLSKKEREALGIR